jgi:hypothetical protein
MIAGIALGALTFFPLFHALTWAANPALAQAQASAPVQVYADPARCAFQFDPIGTNHFDATGCDIAKAYLSKAGVSYASVERPAGSVTEVHVGSRVLRAADPAGPDAKARAAAVSAFAAQAKPMLAAAGYPEAADPARVNSKAVVLIVAAMIIMAAMTYAPAAAFLVELFPARIRYTSLSFPYHLGSGWVGGLLPATAFAIVAANGDIYAGVWYPVGFAIFSTIIALLFIPETRGRPIDV